jgi:hypothetical protein
MQKNYQEWDFFEAAGMCPVVSSSWQLETVAFTCVRLLGAGGWNDERFRDRESLLGLMVDPDHRQNYE